MWLIFTFASIGFINVGLVMYMYVSCFIHDLKYKRERKNPRFRLSNWNDGYFRCYPVNEAAKKVLHPRLMDLIKKK